MYTAYETTNIPYNSFFISPSGNTDGIGAVMSLHLNSKRQLASASTDSSIKIWDIDNLKLIEKYTGGGSAILCVQLSDNIVVGGFDSKNDNLKVWKRREENSAILSGHTDSVLCSQLRDNILISGSYDSSAMIWDITTQKCIGHLKGHNGPIRGIMFDRDKIITASLDQTLKIWDLKTCEIISTVVTENSNTCLHFIGSKLFVGTLEGTVCWFDIPQRKLVKQFSLHSGAPVYCIQADNRKLLSGGGDNCVRLYSHTDNTIFQLPIKHHNAVRSLQFYEDIVCSGSYDNSIGLLRMHTSQASTKLKWNNIVQQRLTMFSKIIYF